MPPELKEFLEFEILGDIIGKKYNVTEEVPDALIRWIEDGLKIHQEGESCKFSGSGPLGGAKENFS